MLHKNKTMAEGYSANPLVRKLGFKEGFRVKLIHAPVGYAVLIVEMFDKLVILDRPETGLDFVHFFPRSTEELEQLLPQLKMEIKKNGMIWISWYKRSSGKATNISENLIRDTALAIGLVDTKVCAIDKDWSGLKLVFRLKDRKE
jgi:hypothetical protein